MSGIYKLPEYKQHPIALELMPGGMDDDEFNAFCEDIEERGIIFPATLYEGMVLDGWHRYRAAKRTGSKLEFKEYTGKDPAGYVAAVNVMRRKLSSLQRCLVGARMHRIYGTPQRDVCKRLGISNMVLSMVLKVLDAKNSRIIKRIETDADYSRGMLRDELAEEGIMTPKASKTPVPGPAPSTPNSVFDMGTRAGQDTEGNDADEEDGVEDIHVPDVGKRRSHPERKPRATPAQVAADDFKALMHGDKLSFLQMIWPEARKLLQEAGLEVAGCLTPEKHPQQELLNILAPKGKTSKSKKAAEATA